MSSGARSTGNRMSRMLVHPYACVQLFHEVGPIGLFLKYLTSFTFRDEDDDDGDSIVTHNMYAKLLHLPDGHVPSTTELSPVFAALDILQAWTSEDRSYYLRRGLQWYDKKSRLFSFFLPGLPATQTSPVTQSPSKLVVDGRSPSDQEVAICFMPKTGQHQWHFCILVDTIHGGKIKELLEACEIQIERRLIHIEHDIHAFL